MIVHAATKIGYELKASYCLDFAGQFSLLHHWTHVDTNPFLKELYSKNNHCFGEAYLYLGESPIYYFEPALCEQDIEQAKYAKMCSNVKILRVRSKTHGCAISPVAVHAKEFARTIVLFKRENRRFGIKDGIAIPEKHLLLVELLLD